MTTNYYNANALHFQISTQLNRTVNSIDDDIVKLYAVLGIAKDMKQNDNTLKLQEQVNQSINSLRLAQQIISDSNTSLD